MIVKGNLPGQKRNRELNGGVPKGWKRCNPNMVPFQTGISEAPVYAVISTWFDADVVGATIQNLLENGIKKIFVLDNDSPDDTQKVAKEFGATEIISYTTEFYDDDLRTKLQNEIIERVTTEEKLSELWWLVLDADEFPTTPDGSSLHFLLNTLPSNLRIVGSNFIDLYPSNGEVYTPGKHPAEVMSKGVWRRGGIRRYCECGHWKHSALKYYRGAYDAAFFRGNHGVAFKYAQKRSEPDIDLIYFHAPIRSKELAYARLEALCGSGRSQWDDEVTKSNGAIKRYKSLENIFSENWKEVELPHTQIFGRSVTGLTLYPWKVLCPGLSNLFEKSF